MFIVEWWTSLTMAAQIFACVAIPSTLLLLIQTILLFIGIDNDADGGDAPDAIGDAEGFDADAPDATDTPDGVFDGDGDDFSPHDAEGLEGLRIFTVRGIVAFLVTFGWMGVALEPALPLGLTISLSAVAGFAVMLGLAFLFRAVLRLRSDGNIDNRNAIGTAGKVHLTIPPARSGAGKVHILLQGSYVERDAVTDDAEPILTGSEIVVIAVSGQTDLVVKRK
jgi:hypothetical protein